MSCLRLMLQEAGESLPGHEQVCRSLLEVVLIRLNRQQDAALAGGPSDPRVSRDCDLVRRYIDNHFKENIEESRFLLRETDHTLSLIAQILGFSSLSYFSQCFRRVEGVSPLEYRRRHR